MFDVLGIDVLELRRIDDGNVINCGGVIDCGSALIDVLELEWRGIHGGGDGGGELSTSRNLSWIANRSSGLTAT